MSLGDLFSVDVFDGVKSSALFCWLARHRGRLRTLVVGGSRLSLIVLWDTRGGASAGRPTDAEIEAVRMLVYGPEVVAAKEKT